MKLPHVENMNLASKISIESNYINYIIEDQSIYNVSIVYNRSRYEISSC